MSTFRRRSDVIASPQNHIPWHIPIILSIDKKYTACIPRIWRFAGMPPYVSRAVLGRASRLPFLYLQTPRRFAHTQHRTLPDFSLEGKVAVVTGASQGLGQQILNAFILSGAHGAVIDLTQDSAQKSVQHMFREAKAAGLPQPKVHAYECDTSSESGVQSTSAKIIQDFGNVDILVTNAGITGGAPAEDYPYEDFKRMIDVNLTGTFLFARTAGKWWIDNHVDGRVLVVSSMSGSIVNRPQKQSAYNASKAASAQLMKSLASEWAPHGIRVNALSPGYIQTEANAGEEMEKLSKGWIKDIPMKRIARPEEFRGAAVWLVSDASSYVTGSEIIVDGGYTIW